MKHPPCQICNTTSFFVVKKVDPPGAAQDFALCRAAVPVAKTGLLRRAEMFVSSGFLKAYVCQNCGHVTWFAEELKSLQAIAAEEQNIVSEEHNDPTGYR